MLNLRMVGIYHTDLPQYIQYYTEDEVMESHSLVVLALVL